MRVELTRSPEELKERFAAMRTPHDLAEILEVNYSTLVYHIYRTPPHRMYKEFDVRKRSGGVRTIRAPQTRIKILQRKLNDILSAVYEPRRCVHGFVKERSSVTNASPHIGAQWVLNVDLVDFFPSINFGRVRGVFVSAPFNLPPSVATVIAKLCCTDNQLPQGSPASPAVANIVAAKLDGDLKTLAARHHCIYTRYADDLTFSTSKRTFPEQLACYVSMGDTIKIGLGEELENKIETNGFRVNRDKLSLRARCERQEVTGITVNVKRNVRRAYVREIRAMLHAWEKYGYTRLQAQYVASYAPISTNPVLPRPRVLDVIHGKIGYLAMVRGNDDALVLKFRALWAGLRSRDGV